MTTLGTATNLTAGTLTCTVPDGTKWWFLQNQDVAPLKVTFPDDPNFGPLILASASALGAGDGGFLDNLAFPYIGTLTLTSTVATAQFGSGCSARIPVNSFAHSV